ncbi:MAG: GNAT family N-acetyltransferase [Lagierella massiliensis]|nr:GNAT family N-acetyltransferase [Lagierella massiliensis]
MELIIQKAKTSQANEILNCLKRAIKETDNLIVTIENLENYTEIEEMFLIDGYNRSKTGLMITGTVDGKIVSIGTLKGNDIKSKAGHRVTMGILVLKEYWNMGIGRKMIETMLDYCVENPYIEIVDLDVRADNYAAISLYERFGFEKIGVYEDYFKDDDESYADAILMALYM